MKWLVTYWMTGGLIHDKRRDFLFTNIPRLKLGPPSLITTGYARLFTLGKADHSPVNILIRLKMCGYFSHNMYIYGLLFKHRVNFIFTLS
jgi:hypothetical protein